MKVKTHNKSVEPINYPTGNLLAHFKCLVTKPLTFGAVFTKVKLVPKRVGFWSMFNKYRLLNILYFINLNNFHFKDFNYIIIVKRPHLEHK
jgi:hypothetical protein